MKFSDLIKGDPNNRKAFLLGIIYAWPIFTKDSDFVLAYSSYKTGKRIKDSLPNDIEFYFSQHIIKLREFLGSRFLVMNNNKIKDKYGETDRSLGGGVSVIFENDIDSDLIYGIIEKWLIDKDDNFKNWFLIGFMESRGSLDFSGNFYSIDITQNKFPKIARRKLNRMNDVVGMIYNYNPRILQEKSNKKNDQFRINMEYFAGHYGFFRPHIIDYYESEKNKKLSKLDHFLFYDKDYKDKKLIIKSNNIDVNDLAISLIGLPKKEKIERIKKYRLKNFDFDTEDEIVYSSYNTKERAKFNANYVCEFNGDHETFTTKSTNNPYVEAHHLIPFSKRKEFEVNIDIEENLIALCPNCHRRIHLSKDNERKEIINKLFSERKRDLEKQMININEHYLYELYNVTNFNKITMVKIPLVGSAPCGDPLLGEENIEEYIEVDKKKIRPGYKYFVLKAEGDSMNLAGINDGDLVLCRRQLKADTGDRVVALLGDDATIKMYDKKDGRRILLPKSTNKIHKPINPEEGDSVQGVVQEILN